MKNNESTVRSKLIGTTLCGVDGNTVEHDEDEELGRPQIPDTSTGVFSDPYHGGRSTGRG
jgi:hypothetical protein